MEIILASASPRRRELMKYITSDFKAVSLDCDETLPDDINPMKASVYLAEIKANAASEQYPDAIVIGCDTTVICNGEILGKPNDKKQCIDYITRLSQSHIHQVVTGCSIIFKDVTTSFSEVTDVIFRNLSDKEIEAYADTDEPYDKAGGYGIQGMGSDLIENIDGDFFNVVGLPVSKLYHELKNFISNIKENEK